MWQVVAGILHLGNVHFKETDGGDKCEVSEEKSVASLQRAAELFGMDAEKLKGPINQL